MPIPVTVSLEKLAKVQVKDSNNNEKKNPMPPKQTKTKIQKGKAENWWSLQLAWKSSLGCAKKCSYLNEPALP